MRPCALQKASSVFGALRWDARSILSPLSISRSNPSPITPAVLPPTHYLQLPAPASTSCGSQQLGLCDQGVCKSDTTTLMQVEVLANACAAVSSSKQVRAASARRTLHRHAFLHSRLTSLTLLPPRNLSVSEPICTSLFPTYCPHNGLSGEPQRQRDRCAPTKAPVLRNAPRRF